MKSVSFSDLRKSPDMISQSTNSGDPSIKRSSSYKNLTYYSSSEDILKRFSTKTNEFKIPKDGYRSDESHNQVNVNLKENASIDKPNETESREKQREKNSDVKTTSSDIAIQELKAVISNQEKTISDLQEKNLILQNESYKNTEEIKFQENRIKYLEHMLAAFNNNLQESKAISPSAKEETLLTGPASATGALSYGNNSRSKGNVDRVCGAEHSKFSNMSITKDSGYNNNYYSDTCTDLKIRPSSADSSLNAPYKYSESPPDGDRRHQFLQSSTMTYTSDNEDRADSRQNNDGRQFQKLSQTDLVTRQRQKLERDRSVNLSDFKSRLDEFTKYAKRSAEQNSLSQHSLVRSPGQEMNSNKKYGGTSDNYSDQQYKVRPKTGSQAADSRPPIDPYYKQRRTVPVEIKTTYDRTTSLSTAKDMASDEDEHLKERVQKILEKHNYPSTAYRTDNSRKISDYTYKSLNDVYYNSAPVNTVNSRGYERSSGDPKYGYQSKDFLDTKESNVPRLDLTLYNTNNTTSNDLITKYLNYQGSTNVS